MAKIKIFGEGPNEIGREVWSPRRKAYEAHDGWLQPIVRRLRSSGGEEVGASWKRLVRLPGRHAPRLSNLAQKAQAAKFSAIADGCAAVIFATDADSNDPRDHARIVTEVEEGFEALPGDIIAIPCVPMATSEAWLLADGAAWAELGATDFAELPDRPERCWGRPHDPSTNHPKCVFVRVCNDNDIPDTSVTRARLAECLSMQELASVCPVSFPPFRDQFSEL